MKQLRKIPFGRPWIIEEDRQAVMEVLNGHILTHGPQGKAFESEFASFLGNDAHCVTVSSCMAALHLAYLYFGVGPGDEVIVPAQTHVATVHAVEWVGARPVFVDCDPATGNLTADKIAPALTSRTKAIGLVHFVGIPCDMQKIMALAEKHDLKVIEDCAIALGARHSNKHVGLFGNAGCFSFYPVKHITSGEGGMFVTRHKDVAGAVAKLRAFGVDRMHAERSTPGMYDVLSLGLNYRMSELQAALGRTQLRRIEENLHRRRVNFESLKTGLQKISDLHILDSQSDDMQNSHYCLSVILKGHLSGWRNQIMARLNAAGIGTSIYYPQPVPRMQYYREKYGHEAARFPNALSISDHSIALPVGHHIDEDDVDYILENFRNILGEYINGI